MPAKLDIPDFVPCLGGCGEMIAMNTHGRRQKYVKQGGIYCRDCVRKLLSERMKKNNPMYDPEIREKTIQSLKKSGTHPRVLGGNGRGLTKGQKLLLSWLGRGWWPELVIPTEISAPDVPTNYKVDIANIWYGIAIEVDGGSHKGAAARAEDARKDAFLKSKGWSVLRFRNKEVLTDTERVKAEILALISRSKETIITLPGMS